MPDPVLPLSRRRYVVWLLGIMACFVAANVAGLVHPMELEPIREVGFPLTWAACGVGIKPLFDAVALVVDGLVAVFAAAFIAWLCTHRVSADRWFTRIATVLLMLPLILPALFLLWFHVLRCGPTYYAPGFTEAKFASLHEGMTPDQVAAIMGPPLEKHHHEDGGILWTYSNREDVTCDYEMRAVFFRNDKVEAVANMHWDE
jgi:hypothetical protein